MRRVPLVNRIPGWLSTTVKILFAVALIYWMVHSGKLDPSDVAGALRNWPELLGSAVLFYLQIAIAAWRWNLLLDTQQIYFPYKDAFSLTMIGTLFNMVIPSSVGGDVMKGYYLTQRTRGKRSQALTTVFLDRVVGLLALLILVAIAATWNLPLIRKYAVLTTLLITVLAIVAAGIIGVWLVTKGSDGLIATAERILHRLPLSRVTLKFLHAMLEFRKRPGVLPVTVAVSVICHVLASVNFYLALTALGFSSVPLKFLFFIVPLGLVTTALPISPAGVGVGQAAFFSLFKMAPGGTGQMGANACTVFQFIMVLVYLTGFFFYFSYKHTAAEPQPSDPVTL